jgi:hypothetical protein
MAVDMKSLAPVVALFLALSVPAWGANAATFRGDLAHTGVYDARGFGACLRSNGAFRPKVR